MIELKGQQAIDYLTSVRSTIHPKDQFCNLPILASMLDIERAYLQRFIDQEVPDLARLTIDATGFPELPSWHSDLKRAYEELIRIKAQRAQSLLPFMQQIFNASSSGIIEQGKLFLKNLSEENSLLANLVNADFELNSWVRKDRATVYSMEKTSELWLKKKEEPVRPLFHTDSVFSGILFTGDLSHRGSYLYGGEKISYEKSGITAFKFIGPFLTNCEGQPTRPPATLLLTIENYNKRYAPVQPYVSIARALTAESALLDRSELDKDCPEYDIKRIKKVNSKSANTFNLEFADDTNQHLLNLYARIDTTTLSDSEFNSFIIVLPKLNQLIRNIQNFINRNIKDVLIDPEVSTSQIQDIAKRLGLAFNSLPNDYLRREVQLSLNEALSNTQEKILLAASSSSIVPPEKSSGIAAIFARFRNN